MILKMTRADSSVVSLEIVAFYDVREGAGDFRFIDGSDKETVLSADTIMNCQGVDVYLDDGKHWHHVGRVPK